MALKCILSNIRVKFYLESESHRPQLLKSHQFSKIVLDAPTLCLAVTAELSPYLRCNHPIAIPNLADYMWHIYVVHICLQVRHLHFLSHLPSNRFNWFYCVKRTMCFKRLDLNNYILDENGSPVCTIDSVRSFHPFFTAVSGKDQAPESPDVIKKATHHICTRPLG